MTDEVKMKWFDLKWDVKKSIGKKKKKMDAEQWRGQAFPVRVRETAGVLS